MIAASAARRMGVDTGGTFTDGVVIDDRGAIHNFKELSTPKDPSVGLYNVIRKAAEHFGKNVSGFLGDLDFFAHGTTVATNTLLTGTGAVTGLILTKGFRDTLEMRRAHKENIWDLYLPVAPPLVPRRLRIGVRERIDCRGAVVQPLVEEDVRRACESFKREGVKAVAVCTLFSFLNDAHEKAIRDIVRAEMPDAFVSISSEVISQIREYERMSTTVANAYVGPKLTVYLSTLERRLKEDGLKRAFYITASNAGVMTAETAIRHASATLLSGPAAGAVGGIFFAELLGRGNLITMDMGGTSFDVTLVNEGKVTLSTEGSIAGYRIAKPMIDINTIGAGGGSVAWIDAGGMLKVGPASAGSDPGPVCYGLGGTAPTVTDANLLLGYLDKDFFLGGEMTVHETARSAMRMAIADPLGMEEVDAAPGIFRIINQSMADASKVVSVQRGHDPREYALVSAGGACSIHACKIAEEVGSTTVIVPKAASVFCALGMLESDIRLDTLKTYHALIPGIDLADFNAVIEQAEAQALAELLQEGVEQSRASLVRHLDMRYVGQHHEVSVEIPSGGSPMGGSPRGGSPRGSRRIEAAHLPIIAERFHAAHERLYTYRTPESALEIMSLRITAVGAVDKTGLSGRPLGDADPAKARKPGRKAHFQESGGFVEVPVFDRDHLTPGNRIPGPAIIEERITTIVVHPGWDARVDEFENVVMEARMSAQARKKEFEGARDPITLSVIYNRLLTINQEMGITMINTSISPIFAEVHDFSCAICDWDNRIVAQIDGVPSHTASVMEAAKAISGEFGADIHPGDVFVLNDPYLGGTHLPDITIMKPIFHEGTLQFIAINRAHHGDVGGIEPGSYAPSARELFHEGIRIPPLRIYRDEKPIMDVVNMIRINTRMPDALWVDMKAQVASCRVAERRILELLSKYGVEKTRATIEDIHSYAERRMRREIERLRDGTYEGETFLDSDGFTDTPIRIKVAIRIQGDEAWVDFAGSDPQVTGFVNSPMANTATCVYVAFLTTVTTPDIPHNEGVYRPVHISAPEGSVVNPRFPAPVASCTLDTACAILEACWMALSKVLPDRVPAGWNRWNGPTITGIDPRSGNFYVMFGFNGFGGAGGMPGMDGRHYIGDGIDLGGLIAPNIETNESDYPHLTEFNEFTTDSCGAGQWRGGCGARYRISLYDEHPTLVMFGDGKKTAPYGLFGGRPGSCNLAFINEGAPGQRELAAKQTVPLAKGDTYTSYPSGGGGWGNPMDRDPESVREDVRNEIISRTKAREVYGVALEGDDCVIDVQGTRELRAGRATHGR